MDILKWKSNFIKCILYDDEDNTMVRFLFSTPHYCSEERTKDENNPEQPLVESGVTQIRKLKGYKSLLSKVSPVFNTMFNDYWDKSEFEMNDPVDFDQFEIFHLFLEIIYGLTGVDTLTVNQAICVHYYAHKYQVDPLIEKIQGILTNYAKIRVTISVTELIDSIKMAELYSLNEFKEQLNSVKLNIKNQSDALLVYKTCMDHNLKGLIAQVVSFLQSKPVEDYWPRNLIIYVLEKNRRKLFCYHGGNDYRRFKSCTICSR